MLFILKKWGSAGAVAMAICPARALCHATLQILRDEYKHIYRTFVAAYREAAAAVAAGCRDTLFPMYAYPPPWPYVSSA